LQCIFSRLDPYVSVLLQEEVLFQSQDFDGTLAEKLYHVLTENQCLASSGWYKKHPYELIAKGKYGRVTTTTLTTRMNASLKDGALITTPESDLPYLEKFRE